MRGKEDLFRLIQEMSRSEKRYFTLDAQKSGSKGSKYLKLFQLINGMDEYDETKLKKKFPKNLSADKAYLYDAILRAMRDYRSSKSYTAQIKEKLLDFRYLHELGLYDQCEERLKEAKELAKELGSTNALLEINYEERRLSYDRKSKNYEEEIKILIKERNNYLAALEAEIAYLDIYDWLLLKTIQHVAFRQEKERLQLQKEFEGRINKIGTTSLEKLSPKTLHRYYQCYGLCNQLIRDYKKMYVYFRKAVDWWADNIKYKEEEYYHYILEVANLVHACFLLEKFDEVADLLIILENSPLDNSHGTNISLQKLINYRLMYFINTGNFKDAPDFINKVVNSMNTMQLTVSGKLAITFNISVVLFIMEDYEQCLEWTNKVIKDTKTEFRQDIQKGIRILNLIANYEVGNFDRTELVIRAYTRYYNDKTNIDRKDFEFQILIFGKKLLAAISEKEVLEDLKVYLETTKQDVEQNIPLGLDDLLIFWVESKLNRTTISSILMEKARKNKEVA